MPCPHNEITIVQRMAPKPDTINTMNEEETQNEI